jgi:hypothetical protein
VDFSMLHGGDRTAALDKRRLDLAKTLVLRQVPFDELLGQVTALGDRSVGDYEHLLDPSARLPDSMPSTPQGLAGVGEIKLGLPPQPKGLSSESSRILRETEQYGDTLRGLLRFNAVEAERRALRLQAAIASLEDEDAVDSMRADLEGIIDYISQSLGGFMQLCTVPRRAAVNNQAPQAVASSVAGLESRESQKQAVKIQKLLDAETGGSPHRGTKSRGGRGQRGSKAGGKGDGSPRKQSFAAAHKQPESTKKNRQRQPEPRARSQASAGKGTGRAGGAAAGGWRGRTPAGKSGRGRQ